MAQSSHLGRGPFQSRLLPDRTIPSSSQPQFGQSAPGFGRQAQYARPPQQPAVTIYPQYAAGAGFGTARGPMRPQAGGMGTERDDGAPIEVTDEQRDEINDAFDIFDLDKDGALDVHELRVAFRALGFDLSKPDIAQLMRASGKAKPTAEPTIDDGRGNLSYHASQMIISHDQFFRLAAHKMNQRNPREEVERAFNLFDQSGKGHIDLADLKRISNDLGETNLDDQELMTMIDEFDYDGLGGISKEAFFGICLQ